jgi:hypothetical protein
MARIEQPTSRNGRHTDTATDDVDNDDAVTEAAFDGEEAMTDAGSEPDFMGELATAMRGVAERERERLTTRAADDAAGHIAEARAHGATEAEAIRRVADEDIASIETWAEAEVARIRNESASRVAERRTDLEAALVRHESVIQREVDSVEGALADYDASLNAFMDDLDEVRDPTEIARLAALLPARPDLGRVREDARTAALDQIAGAASRARGRRRRDRRARARDGRPRGGAARERGDHGGGPRSDRGGRHRDDHSRGVARRGWGHRRCVRRDRDGRCARRSGGRRPCGRGPDGICRR